MSKTFQYFAVFSLCLLSLFLITAFAQKYFVCNYKPIVETFGSAPLRDSESRGYGDHQQLHRVSLRDRSGNGRYVILWKGDPESSIKIDQYNTLKEVNGHPVNAWKLSKVNTIGDDYEIKPVKLIKNVTGDEDIYFYNNDDWIPLIQKLTKSLKE